MRRIREGLMPRHSLALMLEGLRRAGADLAEQTRATFPTAPDPDWAAFEEARMEGYGGTFDEWMGLPDDDAEERAAFDEAPPPDIEPLGDDEPREDYTRDLQDRFPEDE